MYDPNARKHVWTNALVMDDVTFNALLYADMNLSLLVSPVTNIEKEKVKFKLDMKGVFLLFSSSVFLITFVRSSVQ